MKMTIILHHFLCQKSNLYGPDRTPMLYSARRLLLTWLPCLILLAALPKTGFASDMDSGMILDQWRYEKEGERTIRIGIRCDAVPFSYSKSHLQECGLPPSEQAPDALTVDNWENAAGFSVSLCREVVKTINDHLAELETSLNEYAETDTSPKEPMTMKAALVKPSNIKTVRKKEIIVKARIVDLCNRFTALENNELDMLCGATSVTLERTKNIDFSLYTFISGASFMYRSDLGLSTLSDLQGKRVGVLANSSSSRILTRVLTAAKIPLNDSIQDVSSSKDVIPVEPVKIVTVITYSDVLDMLVQADRESKKNTGQLDAFFGDREILLFLTRQYQQRKGTNPAFLTVSKLFFSYEPYALAFSRRNPLLRYYANKTLARLFKDNQITRIINENFGPFKKSERLETLYNIQRIPDQSEKSSCPLD